MKTDRQAHDALTDRREYSPRIWFDPVEKSAAPRAVPPMQCDCWLGLQTCNCCGVNTTDAERKIATDFAGLEGESQRKVDGWVNWAFTLVVIGVAAVAVFK